MYEGSTVTVIGQVDKKEYRISNEQEILVIYLRNVQFLNSANNNEQNMNLMCYMESTEEPKIGSKVCIEGKFREFSHATNPGEFDARKYYQILNLHGRLQRGKVLEESREYDKFREGLYRMKQYCAGLLTVFSAVYVHLLCAGQFFQTAVQRLYL